MDVVFDEPPEFAARVTGRVAGSASGVGLEIGWQEGVSGQFEQVSWFQWADDDHERRFELTMPTGPSNFDGEWTEVQWMARIRGSIGGDSFEEVKPFAPAVSRSFQHDTPAAEFEDDNSAILLMAGATAVCLGFFAFLPSDTGKVALGLGVFCAALAAYWYWQAKRREGFAVKIPGRIAPGHPFPVILDFRPSKPTRIHGGTLEFRCLELRVPKHHEHEDARFDARQTHSTHSFEILDLGEVHDGPPHEMTLELPPDAPTNLAVQRGELVYEVRWLVRTELRAEKRKIVLEREVKVVGAATSATPRLSVSEAPKPTSPLRYAKLGLLALGSIALMYFAPRGAFTDKPPPVVPTTLSRAEAHAYWLRHCGAAPETCEAAFAARHDECLNTAGHAAEPYLECLAQYSAN